MFVCSHLAQSFLLPVCWTRAEMAIAKRMKAMKAMTAMKALKTKKDTSKGLTTGSGSVSQSSKTLPKGSTTSKQKKTLAKGPAKRPSTVMKHSLKAKNLAKLGNMKLVDKIKKAADENEDPEAAAKDLRNLLTKEEASKVWGKHNTWLKNQSEEEQEAHKNKS